MGGGLVEEIVGVSVGDGLQHVGVGAEIGAGEGAELGGAVVGSAMVRAAGEGVSGGVVFAGPVVDCEVHLCKLQLPARLAAAEHGLLCKVLEGLVIGVHVDMAAVYVWAECTQGANDGKELGLVSGVVHLGGREFPGEVPDGLVAVALVLGEHGADANGGGVGVELEAVGDVCAGDLQSGRRGDGGLEGDEGIVGGGGPVEAVALTVEGSDGRGNGAEAFDVAAEEVGKAKEALHFFHGGGRGPVAHSGNLVSCGSSGVGRDLVAEELNGGLEEGALGSFGVQLVAAEGFQHEAQVVGVLVSSGGVHQDVVQVYHDELVQVWAQNIVHECHEGGGGIREPKGHHRILVVAVAGAEGRFGLIARGYPDLVVAAAEVELGEGGGALEGGEALLEQWERVAVLGGQVVEGAVVHTEAHGSIFLLDE